jgi:hypothetical protein
MAAVGFAQQLPQAARVWSVGPLTEGEPTASVTFGPDGIPVIGSKVDSQTGSAFAATRSVVIAGERVVIGFTVDEPGAKQVYKLLSLDAATAEIKDSRVFEDFGVRAIFATSDAHVVVAGNRLLRLTAELADDGDLDYQAAGHAPARVQNMSPDGSTLGDATNPGFALIDARTLKVTELTAEPAVDTSVNRRGFVTDNVRWSRDFPGDSSFVTYTDAAGRHVIYHGRCGGRPQFLTDELVLEPGCKNPLIVDTVGKLVRTLPVTGAFSFAGVSRDGRRFALQVVSAVGMRLVKHESFVVYAVESGEAIAEIVPDELAMQQSWTAFSGDGSMFVVGSPLKLTLYRLP